MHNADLLGASLTFADLTGVDLTDAFLLEAQLTGADLRDTNLTGAYLTGANLTGALYNAGTILPPGIDPLTAGMILAPEPATITLLGLSGLGVMMLSKR